MAGEKDKAIKQALEISRYLMPMMGGSIGGRAPVGPALMKAQKLSDRIDAESLLKAVTGLAKEGSIQGRMVRDQMQRVMEQAGQANMFRASAGQPSVTGSEIDQQLVMKLFEQLFGR